MRVLFIIFFSFFSLSVIAQRYESQEIVARPFQQSINKVGTLGFKRTVNLSFKANGYLKVLTVDEGEYFAAGDTLAALETTELAADKNAKYATLLNAKRNVARISELIAKDLGSAQAFDLAKTEVEVARAAYRSAFYNLDKAQIIAPFSGRVLKRHTDIGELQSPAKNALSVAALANNWIVKVSLTGDEIALIKLNQSVNLRINGIGSINGVVSKVPATANIKTQLFDVEILLSGVDENHRLIAGQLAQTLINITTEKLVFAVPVSALVKINEQGDAVLMLRQGDNAPTEQAFSIHQLNNQYIYLTADTNQDAITVVTHGWHNLK
ncbi:MAG: efflux RND transporter periplasmic adaptor subunit [Thalassotalea sp.]